MKLIYRQTKYRTLIVSLWISLTFGIYINHTTKRNAAVNRSEEVAVVVDSIEVTTAPDDTQSNPPNSVAIANGTHSDDVDSDNPTSPGKLPQSIIGSARRGSVLSGFTVNPIFFSESTLGSKLKLIASTSIGKNAKASDVKPILEQDLNVPTMESKPTPNSDRTLDPMDEYTDMGGIGPMNESGSVIINPHPFNFTLNPADVCDVSEPIFLLIYIHTRPENIKHRQHIRTTWGNSSAFNATIRRIFVMGSPKNAQTQDAIDMESNLYQDILQENFVDSYRNMTYKALGALKWVASYCKHATFIMKTDDDIFVNMPLLIKILAMHHATGKVRSKTIFCNAWHDAGVPRSGKWAVTLKQRKHPTWPTFCQGLSYVMTPDLPAALYNVSFQMPFLWMDDVYVTGFLAKRLGFVHKQFSDYYVSEFALRKSLESPTKWKKTVFAHVHSFSLNKWAWQKVVKLSESHGLNDIMKTNTTVSVQPNR